MPPLLLLLALGVVAAASADAATPPDAMQSRAVDTRVQLEVAENAPRGTLVGSIPTKPGFTYRFNEAPREFVLDAASGEIRTTAPLDREALRTDRYDLVVLSSQPTYPIEVRITVADVNDNSPAFPEPSIAVSFSESAASGTRLLLDAASDADAGANGVSDDYRIVAGNRDDKFRLVVTENPGGEVTYLHLETTGRLDRETTASYRLNVSARDGGSPPRFGFLQVNVTVLDVNDNPPIFDHSDYTVSLNESASPGTHVLQVTATDCDTGDNARITYYLADAQRHFSVDPETGDITTTEPLECPPQQSCQLARPGVCPKSCVFTVFARDHGSPRQDGRTYVTVNLVDANDHDPVIKFRYFPPTASFATVDENAANGSVVAAVSVVDLDEGLNGETVLEIRTGNELAHFRLDRTPSFDIVRVHGVLDRERVNKYNLTVVATDRGSPPRTATAFLVIHVNDVNDHEPVFAKSEYSALLSELAPPGSYVAGISAADEDSGVNARIYYAFVSGNEHSWFHIDADSGLVTTRAPLDREVRDAVELRVSARDGGPNPKWAYTQLKVTVLDENDERPRFSQDRIDVSLSEATPPNTLVAMLTASDHDQGTNGSVTYHLRADYPGVFALDALTGQLTTRAPLDRETTPRYEIRVIAKDQGVPQQSSTATVFLDVQDVNDNAPLFYPRQYFVPVAEDTAVGASLLQVTATDRDDGPNAVVRYGLESGDDALFAIDAQKGVISLKAPLTTSSKALFRLKISATDRGDKRATPDAEVEIVKDSHVEELEFDAYGGYDFQIAEDHGAKQATLGREVGRIRVRGSTPEQVRYSVVFGDPTRSFTVDAATGVIATTSALDREETPRYSLLAVARAGLAYGSVAVNVTVLDLNDNAPQFARDRDEVSVPENAAVGQEVYLARARDRDAGVNSRVVYSLADDHDGQFRIAESTGVVYLNEPIRTEPGGSVTIEIAASDAGRPPLTSRHSVVITVEDVNDHTPVFDHTSYETSLLESTPVNERFFALAASDADLGANGRVSYAITEGDADGKFGVFPDGYLYVRSPLDREERDYYSLVVTASDAGATPRSSQVPVVVHVVDENDNAPQFTNATFVFYIRENEPPDAFVGKLAAMDRDVGRNAELTFSLSGAQRDFAVDPKNGFIKTLHVFDREELVQTTGQSYVVLEASVADNGATRLRDKVKVYVHVTDENDNAPRFLRTPYRVQISEGSSVGTQIFRAFTTDADEGLNGDVFYSLHAGDEQGRFAIDEATGQLTVARPLDRETTSRYSLTVVAQDAGSSRRLSATAIVSVDVLDENDNAPEFTHLEPRVSVAETTPVNTRLVQFAATDADLGVNSEVTFSIGAGNRRDTFHVDPATGALYLHKPLDYEELAAFTLNITASDGGNPRLATTVLFHVAVEDSNDNPPAFPNTAIVRQIREGIPENTPIVTVTAEDPDAGVNGKVAYAIANQEPVAGGPHFGINPATGVIHTLLPIDREAVDTFRLTVVATDQALPETSRLSAEKLVTVIVEDVNDNAPLFVSMNAAVLSPPSSSPRHGASHGGDVLVMYVRATDLDSSTNGLVTYELVSGGGDLYRLHRSTGALTLRRGAVLGDARYHLAVKATDEAVQAERKSSDAYITVIAPATPTSASPPPRFETSSPSGSVYENEPPGTSVLTVRAAATTPGAEVEYYVTNVTAAAGGRQSDRLFDVDTRLGVLSTAAALDREAGADEYEVTVFAVVVNGAAPSAASTTVRVSVLDRNDSPPSFAGTPTEVSVSEDLSPGQTVATLRARDPDLTGETRYSLLGGDQGRFAVDPGSGVVRLRHALDRETCDVYRLALRASDGEQHSDTVLTVHVTDTNDNPPVFSESAYSFDVAEDTARGARVGEVAARDDDQGVNGHVTFSVISDWANDVFSLNPQTGVFTLTARLDYEEVQHYIFVVQAQDSGRPALSSTLTVFFNVLDLNDNAPLFDPMSYSNEVFENVTVGSGVVTVSATDLDSGDNGRIEYSISAGDEAGDFGISDNGTIFTKRALDREAKSLYNLVVTAADRAKPPQPRLSSTVQVTIVLKDVNDAAPEFISPDEVSVAENVAPNTVVLAVKAVDRDEGRNGYIEYSLSGEGATLFALGAVDGLLRVAGRLDREVRASYPLRVTARDRGEPPLAASATLTVRVLDENDNSPVFDPRQYSASVAENASVGASVLQVSATDVDEGADGRVRYAIVAGDDNRDFGIGEDSGVLRVAKNLNFERKSRYLLTVRAEDCASDDATPASDAVRYDTATVAVTVTDINDNPPTFLDSPYLAYVMENVVPPASGAYVLTVRAHDADSAPHNGQVRYFLKEGDADLFRVNATSGEVVLLRPLDRETQPEYVLTLVAMDTGTPPLTGTGTVRVVVQDVNDHSPEFPRQAYAASVAENLPVGAEVLLAAATDRDAGANARLRYSLLGDKASRFSVDAATGLVSTAEVLDREETPLYHLTLVAQDASPTEPRAAAVNVTIVVADANDNAPRFSAVRYAVHVPERTQTGQFVFGAKATDDDDGANSRVTFSLSGDDASFFSVDPATGVVSAARELTGGDDRTFRVTLHATDGGVEPRAAQADLTVKLRPARLFPTLSVPGDGGATRFTLSEDVAAGRVVARLSASSPKRGPAGAVRFAVAGGNVGDALRVDAASGEVVVAGGGLDFETAPSYDVWVEARDSDIPPLRTVLKLSVNVTDANDNAPVLDSALYNATVPEEEPPPLKVVRVRATDADSGLNGRVMYKLTGGAEDSFEIDPDTGDIVTSARLDREAADTYQLTVEAVDRGTPSLTGSATVVVTVSDKNDNPPRFTRLFSVNVTENAEPGAFVIKLTSADLDVGENANASYSFTDNPGDKFAIDALSGDVTVAGPLDRETQDEFLLKVAAVDGSWRAETPLTVTIQDQNDNAPEFEHSYYSFNFPELQRDVVFVGQVTATDRDKQGPNSVVSYSLKLPSDLFTVDPANGELFSKRSLRYKHTPLEPSPENQYVLTIVATDNGKPPMSSECLVTVNVVDANNNAPKFERSSYFTPVPEIAAVGQQILKVTARDDADFGVNAEVRYVEVGGNGSELFDVAKATGWVSVAAPLEGAGRLLEYYTLRVRAVDRGVPPQHDDVTVTLVVTGENRRSPVFTALSYQVIVPENEPVGSTIVTVSAADGDEGPNGMVRYTIHSGNERGEFSVHPTSGAVSIRQPLDYDSVQEYHLNLTATDLGFEPRRALATLTVTLTDVNDNAPVFDRAAYEAFLPENSSPQTSVFRVRARDADSAKNAVVQYSVVGGSGKDVFGIDAETGAIYSRASFDYEEKSLYTLDVLAANPDSPMYGSCKVAVHVTGRNEFYPRFVQPVFHFDVSESAEVGTSVGTIQATDQDAGDDGVVYYLLVGSSNDRGFSVGAESGVVKVSRRLDRETQNRVVLTVMAKNAGGIRGNDTDEAQVIVSVQDGNDPPEFARSVYESQVSEGAAPGTRVVTVKAVDKDVRPQNNQFSYSIIGGNSAHAFKVDPLTGDVETTARLDRETVPVYTLTVGAIDTGTPPQTGTTMVRVSVQDVNDNGPVLEPPDVVGYVTENEPPNTSVMTLGAVDPDLPPNGAPFTYALVGGRHRDLVAVERHSGVVTTTRSLDREATPKLDIVVEIEDSGEPQMKSQHPVSIVVLDQNDSPSTPRAVHVLVHTFNDAFPLGKIADVRPNDADTSGDYQCKLMGATDGTLSVAPGTCDLHASKIDSGAGYSLSVSGNDGVHPDVVSTVTVEFVPFDNSTVDNSLTLRIENMTATRFLEHFYKGLLDALKAASGAGDVPSIFGIREVDDGLDVVVAVRGVKGYRDKTHVAEALSRRRAALQQLLAPSALTVGYSPCQKPPCENGAACSDGVAVAAHTTLIADSRTLVLTSPLVSHDFRCRCAEGFTGRRCERRQDPCSPNPCQAGGTCRRLGFDFQCQCSASREGRTCELERGAVCDGSPCLNGGSCRESPDGASFFCLCRPGYRGNRCEAAADSCRPNPCLHGGVCVATPPGYRCRCPEARYGRHCQSSAYGFGELSYAAFPPLDAATNDVSVVFATTKPDALLVYNYGAQTGGRSDFVALELVAGRATFSFGGARTAITTVTAGASLADGLWHKVTATRNGRVASLSVASCTDNGDSCQDCTPGDASCSADDFGPAGTLNFNGQPMLIGGLASADPVLERPGQVHSDDLVGCVHSVAVNGRPLNLSNPLRVRGVEPTCGGGRPCDAAPGRCGPSGACLDRWQGAACLCDGRFVAPDCGAAFEPVSLAADAFVEFAVSEKHRRMQLLEPLYRGSTLWRRPSRSGPVAKTLGVLFRTVRRDGLLLFSASNKDFTSVELRDGHLVYVSRLGAARTPVNMTVQTEASLADGRWHNVTLHARNRVLTLYLDGVKAGDELDVAGVHDFLDPDITALSVGGARREFFDTLPQGFEGCLANLSINNEIQPFNGSGSVFPGVATHGSVGFGCQGPLGVSAATSTDPLSIGITLVIVFFVILLVAILISFVVFRLRRQKKEKGGEGAATKQNGGATLVAGVGGGGDGGGGVGGGGVLGRTLGEGVGVGSYLSDGAGGEMLRAAHHLVGGPELISKKYKEREIVASEPRPQRPDIIEREVVGKSLRGDDHHPPLLPPPSTTQAPPPGPVDLDLPEHYDLENASSIAPSDIDIVYHYKGYREGGNVRKYKATPPHLPPPSASYHHKHGGGGGGAGQQQHRHSPHHGAGGGGFAPPPHPRDSPRSAAPPPPTSRVDSPANGGGGKLLQSTPLARLSPSSELSSQAPRILTLQDISGKPLPSALLATTSSSGGVGGGKDPLHSNSERSLNSPVMSQLSGQSSSASRGKVVPGANGGGVVGPSVGVAEVGLTAEEIERLNSRPRTSSLVSTLDAVSSSSEAPRGRSGAVVGGNAGSVAALHHLNHLHHGVNGANNDDNGSSTTTDESGNDSFTCSEFEYDNSNEKVRGGVGSDVPGSQDGGKPPLPPVPPASYDGFDSSFRGSLSTLVASDDDLSTHMGAPLYRPHNGGSPSSATAALGWDYLLNWGPNFESLVGVFKDIAELPDSVNGRVAASLRLPNSAPKPSEEYV